MASFTAASAKHAVRQVYPRARAVYLPYLGGFVHYHGWVVRAKVSGMPPMALTTKRYDSEDEAWIAAA